MKVIENASKKILESEDMNYRFDKKTGFTMTWGKTLDDDPDFCQYGPMIADIEITDICKGVGDQGPCKFCYKSNTAANKKNMSFDTYKIIIDKIKACNNTITQVAFGADAQTESNPDIWKIAEYTRSIGIIPNITVADITDEVADKLSKVMGAVAVSRYEDKNYCYNSVKKLTDRGMDQVNIHQLVHAGNIDQIKETFADVKNDPRLAKLNAIVLLSLKKKGRGSKFQQASVEQFKEIVDYAMDNNIRIGFDSCSCCKFLQAVKDRKEYKSLEMCSEKCESTLFSVFINVDCEAMPCSFCDKVSIWNRGIYIIDGKDFHKDVWMSNKFSEFRTMLLNNDRNCPVYQI
jgi:MoaA/NifB/PqqE/SkfB family radical SAM enzyme